MCAFRAHINQTLFKNINNITKIILQNGSYITRQLRVSSLLWFKVTRSRVRVLRLVIYTSCYTNTNSVKKKTFIPVYLRFEVWETTSLLHTTQRERGLRRDIRLEKGDPGPYLRSIGLVYSGSDREVETPTDWGCCLPSPVKRGIGSCTDRTLFDVRHAHTRSTTC